MTTLLAAHTAVSLGPTLHAWAVAMHGEASNAPSLRRRHHPAARVSWRCHSRALSGRVGREQRRIIGLSGRVCFVSVHGRYVGPRGPPPKVYGDVTGPPQVLVLSDRTSGGKGLKRMHRGSQPYPLRDPRSKKNPSSWVCQVGSMEISKRARPVIKHDRHSGHVRSFSGILLVMIGAMS